MTDRRHLRPLKSLVPSVNLGFRDVPEACREYTAHGWTDTRDGRDWHVAPKYRSPEEAERCKALRRAVAKRHFDTGWMGRNGTAAARAARRTAGGSTEEAA